MALRQLNNPIIAGHERLAQNLVAIAVKMAGRTLQPLRLRQAADRAQIKPIVNHMVLTQRLALFFQCHAPGEWPTGDAQLFKRRAEPPRMFLRLLHAAAGAGALAQAVAEAGSPRG